MENLFGDIMRIINIIYIVLLTFSANQTLAAKVQTKVDFNSPENFTDFKTQINSQNKDRERLMNELQELIITSSNKILPNDNTLEITINNIDMAGRFKYSVFNHYRFVNDTDRIKLDFYYKMLDVNGNLILEDSVSLTTRNPMSIRSKSFNYKHTNFTYEMPLYDRWLRKLIQ